MPRANVPVGGDRSTRQVDRSGGVTLWQLAVGSCPRQVYFFLELTTTDCYDD